MTIDETLVVLPHFLDILVRSFPLSSCLVNSIKVSLLRRVRWLFQSSSIHLLLVDIDTIGLFLFSIYEIISFFFNCYLCVSRKIKVEAGDVDIVDAGDNDDGSDKHDDQRNDRQRHDDDRHADKQEQQRCRYNRDERCRMMN